MDLYFFALSSHNSFVFSLFLEMLEVHFILIHTYPHLSGKGNFYQLKKKKTYKVKIIQNSSKQFVFKLSVLLLLSQDFVINSDTNLYLWDLSVPSFTQDKKLHAKSHK